MAAITLILKAIAEIGVILVVLRGFINENKLVRFEKKIFRIMKDLRKKRRAARAEEHRKMLLNEQLADECKTERRCSKRQKKSNGKVA